MYSLKKALSSGLARKLLNGATAIGIVVFVVIHLLGNLVLYWPAGQEAFDAYSATLHGLGWGLYVIEAGLFIIIGLHAWLGISLWLDNRRARKKGYDSGQKTKGGPSKFNWSSLSMPLTGSVLLVFIVVHVLHFRYAAFTDTAKYEPTTEAANFQLYQMVIDAFANPLWVGFYCLATFLLGWHLRHGLWSMLQTIGAMNERWSKPVYALGTILAVVLAAGFFGIPLYIYFVIH